MAELMMFQPGTAFMDSYNKAKAGSLAKIAFTEPQRRQSALADLYGLDPQAANSMKKEFDAQEQEQLKTFAAAFVNAPDDTMREQMYARAKEMWRPRFQALGSDIPDDWRQALPTIQALAGAGNKGKYTGAPIIVKTDDGPKYARYSESGMEVTDFAPDDRFTMNVDAEGNVRGYNTRRNVLAPTADASNPQPVQQGDDPMAPYLERIRMGGEVLAANNIPTEQINAWKEAEFAKAQQQLSANGVQVTQPAPQPARVAVKQEAPKAPDAPSGYRFRADGGLMAIPGGPADPANKAAGTTTEDMRKTATLLSRMNFALGQIQDVEAGDKSANRPGYGTALLDILPDAIGNDMKSSNRQQIEAAQLDALDAALTLATGAAYTKEQLIGLRKAYFPQPNDSEATIKAKQARFQNVIESARVRAGNAGQNSGKPNSANNFDPLGILK